MKQFTFSWANTAYACIHVYVGIIISMDTNFITVLYNKILEIHWIVLLEKNSKYIDLIGKDLVFKHCYNAHKSYITLYKNCIKFKSNRIANIRVDQLTQYYIVYMKNLEVHIFN